MAKPLNPLAVLVRPLITEKATRLGAENKYCFEVRKVANKAQIKEAVELTFGVSVRAVNTMNVKGKPRRFGRAVTFGQNWKKAIVTLVSGDTIELFEGI